MNILLTSSFATVAKKLFSEKFLPPTPQRVAFITTAANPYEKAPWQIADRAMLASLDYEIFDVDLKNKNADELRSEFENANIIFVAGGNTTYLTDEIHRSGFDTIIRDLLASGRIYIGSSAGSIVAGPSVEPFIEEDLPELPADFAIANPSCLGLVNYIIFPHHPTFAESDTKARAKFGDRFTFVTMTDEEYKTALLGAC